MKLISSLLSITLVFATTTSAWNLREKDAHSTTFNLMQHQDGSVHMFEETNKYAVGMLGKQMSKNFDDRVFKVHGNQHITGKLRVDEGILLTEDQFNILDDNDNVIFDLEHHSDNGTLVEIGADGTKQIQARAFNSDKTNGIYACSICHDKIPDEDADENGDGESNGLRLATEKMVRNYVANPLDPVSMAQTLDVTGATSVSTFDSSGASSLATGGGAVSLASAGADTNIKGSLSVNEAATLAQTLDVTGVSQFDDVLRVGGDNSGSNDKFKVDTDGGVYSSKDIVGGSSPNEQLVNFGSLKAQGEARYEYMIQVLCNTLGLNFQTIEAGYTAAIDPNAANPFATDGNGTTVDKFGGINPMTTEINGEDDATLYDNYVTGN